MNRYGIPYQGSKNAIAAHIVREFLTPSACLVDIFAGGCAITHAALEAGWHNVIANDISDAPELFAAAARGEYKNEKRWISREYFERLKNDDAYVRYCWSFGNNAREYLYSREIEPWKKALHYARVLGDRSLLRDILQEDCDGSRAAIMAKHDEYTKKYIKWWIAHQKYSAQELDELIKATKEDIKRESEILRTYLCNALKDSGLTQSEVNKRLGTQMAGHYFGVSQWQFPTREFYAQMQTFMPALTTSYDEITARLNLMQSLQRLQSLQSLQSLESLESLERLERLQSLQSLESLQRLERLQSLQSLERLQSLEITHKDYRQVDLPVGCIVYADPPYKDTSEYSTDFDHAAFYSWAAHCQRPLLISEYDMPREIFACIGELKHVARFSQTNKKNTERLFVPRHQLDTWRNITGNLFLTEIQ